MHLPEIDAHAINTIASVYLSIKDTRTMLYILYYLFLIYFLVAI